MAVILIIEDDETIRSEVVQWLQFEDHEVLSAANGREGIRLALEHKPDLIVSDILMPETDGYRVLFELRVSPSTALIPFIFMSAKAERQDLRYGMELGADDYLSKPFTRGELMRAIEKRIQRHASYQTTTDQQIATVKRSLLRRLSHELRTPLVGVLGIGELLTSGAATLSDDEIVEYGQLLTSSAHRLSRLVDNYLLYMKLESEVGQPFEPPMALPARETVSVIRGTSEQAATDHDRRQDLSISIHPFQVQIEANTLRKIVYELVDNAFKFSTAKQKVIVTGKHENSAYVLRVADQGRGIAADDIPEIAAYVQFGRDVYEQQGLGLGLSIVKRLVELGDGSLHIESAVGKGTIVTVSLPAGDAT